MRHSFLLVTLLCLSCAAGRVSAQSTIKAGLWEGTTTIVFQKSPFPPEMKIPQGSVLSGAPVTNQVCITQAQIDQFGAGLIQKTQGCKLTDMVKNASGFTAKMICSGNFNATGTVDAGWSDPEHAKNTIHLIGTMQFGQSPAPFEWTATTVSAFKQSDCGDVKPVTVPSAK